MGNEWGGTLLEVSVLTVISVDLRGYRGLVVDAVALARRRSRGRQGHRADAVRSAIEATGRFGKERDVNKREGG